MVPLFIDLVLSRLQRPIETSMLRVLLLHVIIAAMFHNPPLVVAMLDRPVGATEQTMLTNVIQLWLSSLNDLLGCVHLLLRSYWIISAAVFRYAILLCCSQLRSLLSHWHRFCVIITGTSLLLQTIRLFLFSCTFKIDQLNYNLTHFKWLLRNMLVQ